MNKEIKNFFHTQLNEHELVLKKTKLHLEKDFIKLVNICVESVKKKKKNYFFWKWWKRIRLSAFSD